MGRTSVLTCTRAANLCRRLPLLSVLGWAGSGPDDLVNPYWLPCVRAAPDATPARMVVMATPNTPLWVPLLVAAVGVAGSVTAALLTQRASRHREDERWRREREVIKSDGTAKRSSSSVNAESPYTSISRNMSNALRPGSRPSRTSTASTRSRVRMTWCTRND
jgi:hypothetical protein